MSNRTRTYPVLAVVGASLLFGSYASTSCIIPDHGITVPVDCGIRWYGEANGAQAYNFGNQAVDVLDGGSSWPRGAVCMTAYQDWLLKEGLDYECDQHTDETSCDNDANCSWEYDLICLPDSVPWQARWLDLVNAAYFRCLQVADDNDLNPAPECEQVTEEDCEAEYGCVWSGSQCEQVEEQLDPNCDDAAFFGPIFTNDEKCVLEQCNPAPGGTGTGGAGTGGTGTGGGYDESGTGSGMGSDPWGDLGTMIACYTWGCVVDQQLVENVMNNPEPMLDDSTRLEFYEPPGEGIIGMQISGIDTQEPTGELADRLQFHDGDIILEVDGMPLTNLDELLAIGDHLLGVSQTLVKIRRGRSTFTFWYMYPLS